MRHACIRSASSSWWWISVIDRRSRGTYVVYSIHNTLLCVLKIPQQCKRKIHGNLLGHRMLLNTKNCSWDPQTILLHWSLLLQCILILLSVDVTLWWPYIWACTYMMTDLSICITSFCSCPNGEKYDGPIVKSVAMTWLTGAVSIYIYIIYI